jgi:hypothetical protein
MSRSGWNETVLIDGRKAEGIVNFNQVGPEYFKTMGTPVLAGRTFGPEDSPGAPAASHGIRCRSPAPSFCLARSASSPPGSPRGVPRGSRRLLRFTLTETENVPQRDCWPPTGLVRTSPHDSSKPADGRRACRPEFRRPL